MLSAPELRLSLYSQLMQFTNSYGGLSSQQQFGKHSFERDLLTFTLDNRSDFYQELLSVQGLALFIRENLPKEFSPPDSTDSLIVHALYESYDSVEVRHFCLIALSDVVRGERRCRDCERRNLRFRTSDGFLHGREEMVEESVNDRSSADTKENVLKN